MTTLLSLLAVAAFFLLLGWVCLILFPNAFFDDEYLP